MFAHSGLKLFKDARCSRTGHPQLGLVARQLDDFHHQADDRDDERRGAEHQCYYSCCIYMNHLLATVRLTAASPVRGGRDWRH